MLSNKEIRALSWKQLKSSYWMIFVMLILFGVIMGALSSIGVGFILMGPGLVGLSAYLLDVITNKENSDGSKFDVIVDGFKDSFVNSLVAYLLSNIFLFLWGLLLVIPGIIKSYSYSQIYYIIRENPEIGPMEAIDKSREMMDGKKGKLFMLDLSFIGWYLLGLLAFGVGVIFVVPYHRLARANFYNELREKPTPTWNEEFQEEF
ncbi:DUF975 family protein [Mycoplasmatota bacterium]|nr:DUF975 family protein [Mycoplasmatota bacterium]